MYINAENMPYKELNKKIKDSFETNIEIANCLSQRYIGNALSEKHLSIHGTAGNILGGFLNGAQIEVFGNVQEGCANTMNAGRIVVHGRAGDALAYGMRGGEVFIRDDIGSRGAIHMKEYKENKPIVVIGGCAKDFLAEYLSGGIVIVLNMQNKSKIVGRFCGVGAHGGTIYLRIEDGTPLPNTAGELIQVDKQELQQIEHILERYDSYMKFGKEKLLSGTFYKMAANKKNPYEGLYVSN